MSLFFTSVVYIQKMLNRSNIKSIEEIVKLSRDSVEAKYDAKMQRLGIVVNIPEIANKELSPESKINLYEPEISSQEKYADLSRLAKEMKDGKETTGLYNIWGKDSYVRYEKIPLCYSDIAIVVSKDDFYSNVKSLVLMLTTIILIALVVVTAIIIPKVINMCNRLSTLNVTVENFAAGDFASEIPENLLSSKDEIGNIFNSINHSKTSLRNTISSIKENSNIINNEIEGLADT